MAENTQLRGDRHAREVMMAHLQPIAADHQRLTQELRADRGPLALRAVLPAARPLRQIHMTFRSEKSVSERASALKKDSLVD
jgi:hypothetical protein